MSGKPRNSLARRRPAPAGRRLFPGGPLWERAPSRLEGGAPACDFLLLVPGLGQRTPDELTLVFAQMERVLEGFGDRVLMADFNARLNLLWVSHVPEPGLAGDLRDALTRVLPGAKLVAQPLAAGEPPALPRRRRWLKRLARKGDGGIKS